MASVSGATSSLGNTSLRGYGGFGSGIDRDSIIEQMTAGTQSKITNQKNKMTSLGWKQEAFQAVSDKMLALQDNYFSFASGTNLRASCCPTRIRLRQWVIRISPSSCRPQGLPICWTICQF